jgi:flagellar M-ring protein FliF
LQKDALPVFPQNGPQNGNGSGESMKQESGTYAVTRHMTHSEAGPGRVRRITAAVVVNDRMQTENAAKAPKTIWKPRTQDEMHRLEQLAQAAVGFDEERGDQLALENVSFTSNAPETPVTGLDKTMEQARSLLATQPAMLKTATIGLLGIMVVMLVLRPVAGQVVAAMKQPLLLASGQGVEGEETRGIRAGMRRPGPEIGSETGSAIAFNADSSTPLPLADQAPRIFDEVAAHIKRDPMHSTRLLEAWISADGDD